MKKKQIVGFHFVSDTLQYTLGKVPRDGVWLKLRGKTKKIRACRYGLHASRKVCDASDWAPRSSVSLCLVIVRGDLSRRIDKFAGRERMIVARVSLVDLIERMRAAGMDVRGGVGLGCGLVEIRQMILIGTSASRRQFDLIVANIFRSQLTMLRSLGIS